MSPSRTSTRRDERISGLSGVIRHVGAKPAHREEGVSLPLSLCAVQQLSFTEHHYAAGSQLTSEVWQCISLIWDSLVTRPIKHDQLNIFALNVCRGAPMWMRQTER